MNNYYVVMQHWSNGDYYNELTESMPIGTCKTIEIARDIIDKQKEKLIAIASEYPDMVIDNSDIDDYGGVLFHHDITINPFRTCNDGCDIFDWTIQEVPFIES